MQSLSTSQSSRRELRRSLIPTPPVHTPDLSGSTGVFTVHCARSPLRLPWGYSLPCEPLARNT
eukprot:1718285-Alexandrium_andersonii.AAC.1